MSFDFGALFSGIGGGLSNYAALKERDKNDEEERKRENARLALEQATLDETKREHQSTAAATERTRLDKAASDQLDRLSKQGVIPPDSYESSARAAALPQTGGQDVAGMAINALRTAGQADTKQFDTGVTSAMNDLYKSGNLSADIPGGGRVYMEPGVRSNLDVAQSNAATAAENRRNAVKIARINADARLAGKDPAVQTERDRVKFMNDGIARRMKPRPDPDTGRLTQPGMSQSEAYRETKQEYDLIHNNASAAPAGVSTPSDPDAEVRSTIAGMDSTEARQNLETAGYTPDEIARILQQ